MALVLGVKIGEVIDIADHWLTVLSTTSHNTATVIADSGWKATICSGRMIEVLSDVWVSLDPGVSRSRLRLRLEAPRHLSITRRVDPAR